MAQSRIEIPLLHKEDEVLELETSNLPEYNETVGILRDQACKISLWIQVATEYYRQANYEAFETILKSCVQTPPNYPDWERDRIKALDLLGIYFARRASKESNQSQKKEFLGQAAQKFAEVDKSEIFIASKNNSEYHFHLLGRAFYCLVEGRNEQADAQFKFVSQGTQPGEPENIPSLLGRACIEFNKKEVKSIRGALTYFRRAIRNCPHCPADVYLGLGICLHKLNLLDKAEHAFKLSLKIDAKCVGALVGLSVIELNRKTTASIKNGIECLVRAYKLDQTNPMVLILLADHYFYRGKHEEVIKLAFRAIEKSTDNEPILARAYYQLGRAHHRKEEFNNAFEYYYKATEFGGPQFSLAFYGLGQIYIHRQEFDAAIQAFEEVLKANPDNMETLEVLASLYARSTNQTKKELAKTYLKRVLDNKPNYLEGWLELASLIETEDTQGALNAYRKALNLYEVKKEIPPAELFNNMAALLFSVKTHDEAKKHFCKALEICEEKMPLDKFHYGSIIYTIRYNLGRLYESIHQLSDAEKIYKDILKQHPMYIDCYLRLGCMERERGMLFNASDKFKETFRIDQDNPDAWTLIGNLHLSKQEWGPAQKKFERILESTKQNPDCYSLISVGNVWLQNQYLATVRDKDKINNQLQRALTFYRSALKHDPKNIYAASGIGCILAVKGLLNEARDVFSQVREATADFPDVWINIAHIYVEQKQYVAAVQMYENCLKKFYNNSNTELLLYIARALFKANKLQECKKVLLKARRILPYDSTILFNLAKVLKTLARQVFSDNKSSFSDVVAAEYELKLAQTYFKHHQAKNLKNKSAVDPHIVSIEERDCADLILQVETTIKLDAEKRDKEDLERRHEHEEKLARELARKQEEEQRLQAEIKLKREEQANKRKELLRKQEEEKAKQKMMKDDMSAMIDDRSDNEDGGPRKKRKKTSGNKESKRRERPDKADRGGDSDRGEQNKRFKSRAILSSSSSSSSSSSDSSSSSSSDDDNDNDNDNDSSPNPRVHREIEEEMDEE